jgi:prepilin peptidase dependent protein B
MSLTKKNSRQTGFTLMELMVALVINVMIFASLLAIFIANLQHHMTAISVNRLNQQLQAAMELMTTDIRRAGYWANASTNLNTDTNTNPFQSTVSGTDLTIGGTGNSCILLTYDHNKNGVLPSVSTTSDDERYGYRLNGTALQERPWGASFSCGAGSTAWENVTDATITITALSFTLTSQSVATGLGSSAILQRSIDISLTGQLTSNSAITKTLTQHVRIRNDKFVP